MLSIDSGELVDSLKMLKHLIKLISTLIWILDISSFECFIFSFVTS